MQQDWHDYFLTPEEKRIKMLEELVNQLQDENEKLKEDKKRLLKTLDEKSRKDLDSVVKQINEGHLPPLGSLTNTGLETTNYNSKCWKCVNEVKCKTNGIYKSNCKDYKRDASDGGYYG